MLYICIITVVIILSLPFTHIFFLCNINSLIEKNHRIVKNNVARNCKKIIQISLVAVFVLLPIVIFLINFSEQSLSDDIEEWGAFGDYIGGIYSVYISIGLFLLSRKLGKTDERRNKQRLHIEKLYGMIRLINNDSMENAQLLKDFVNEIASAELYLSDDVIKRVIELQDNFAEASVNPELRNIELESEVLGMLKYELKRI